jgi:diguanylate cyclase (GGDEF)-like protein
MDQPLLWLTASLLLVTGGLYLAHRTYRALCRRLDDERLRARQMSELHLATIEALALAIDARDQTARNRIRRVQVYSTGVARALGMNDGDVDAVSTAALLHDVGKLAVPDYILAKPGPLTPEEFQRIRIHPQVGADIVSAVPFLQPVMPLILAHHERWDGHGYPLGLAGEQIPLGARILCVVDYFDALTSERPYQRPVTTEAAIGMLEQESAKAFDPRVIDAFLRALPSLQQAGERANAQVPSPSSVREIALAHREIYELYQIAQTMGTSLGVADTMALISSKLTNLVPFSASALFLFDEGLQTAACRFATGTDSELIQQLSLRGGQGITGWVARNRRPLVNGRPSADLEAAGSNLPTSLQSALICPLMSGERLIGTLAVYHVSPNFYRDDHRRLLERVCEQAAAVIHNAIVFEQTQEASLTDPLTALPNTRSMLMHLGRELARAERLKSEVSLLVMDLNDFKAINDTYGHHVGDRALREVASALRSAVRPYDVCVRYAGDEFIVVLAGCGRDEAERKRVELQQMIDRIEFEPTAGQRVALSISAGAAVFPHDGEQYEALLEKADSRMYEVKHARKRGVIAN